MMSIWIHYFIRLANGDILILSFLLHLNNQYALACSVPKLQTPWTVALQALLFMRLPFPPPGDLPDPGTEPVSPALQVDFFTAEPPGKPLNN